MGLLAESAEEYAEGMHRVLSMSQTHRRVLQVNARLSCGRFSAPDFRLKFAHALGPVTAGVAAGTEAASLKKAQ